jgi:hypothetical protein
MTSAPTRSWLPRRSVAASKAGVSARPMLECLETREAPVAMTSTTITNISQSYTLLSQNESISAQVTSPILSVTTGQVTFTDNGQTQIVNVNSAGQATANFSFSLFGQAIPGAHTVTASFNDSSGLFNSSSTSAQANDTTGQFLFTLLFDIVLIQQFTGRRII